MLSAYSSGGDLPNDYIANMAQVLSQFPREVAVQACSPIHGVARECRKFRPNVGEMFEWCEIRTEPIWERAKLERPALPPPTVSDAAMMEGKKHVANVLAKFLETKVVKKSWFDGLDVEEIKHRFPGIADV